MFWYRVWCILLSSNRIVSRTTATLSRTDWKTDEYMLRFARFFFFCSLLSILGVVFPLDHHPYDVMSWSCALLPLSPAGRQVYTELHRGCPPLGERGSWKCCPCCLVMCSYNRQDKNNDFKWKKSSRFSNGHKRIESHIVNGWMDAVGVCEVVQWSLTLCHRECSKVHAGSSGTTRCHDMSNPIEKQREQPGMYIQWWKRLEQCMNNNWMTFTNLCKQ